MSVLFPAVLATASPDCLDRLYPATVILSQIVINPLSVMISATLSAAGECVKGPAPGQPRCKSGGVACLESYQHCVEDHLSRQATAFCSRSHYRCHVTDFRSDVAGNCRNDKAWSRSGSPARVDPVNRLSYHSRAPSDFDPGHCTAYGAAPEYHP
jgi:hypothetical protein